MISIYGEVIANEMTMQYVCNNERDMFQKNDSSAWGSFQLILFYLFMLGIG